MTQKPDRSLRLPEVQAIVPYSKVHIDRLEKAGLFPKRIHFGVGRVAWLESEVIAHRDAKRNEQPKAA